MVRFGQRFELLDAAGKQPNEAFSPDELGDVRAMIAAGGSPLGGDAMDMLPNSARSSATAPAMTAST